MKLKIIVPILVVVSVLLILILIQLSQTLHLQNNFDALNNQIQNKEAELDNLTKASLQKIDFGFVNNNFTGTVFNSGQTTAHNAKVVLTSQAWSWNIMLGDITAQNYKSFNEYVPVPENYSHSPIVAQLEWT